MIKLANYRSICIIPSDFFNNGIYSLSLNLFSANFSDTYMIKDVINFEVLDSNSIRKDYYGVYEGVVRPKLKWMTNTIVKP